MTKSFNILIYKQNRVLLSVLIFVPMFMSILFLPILYIQNLPILWSTILIGGGTLIALLIYSTCSKLHITCKNDVLQFDWKKKIFFNYNDIKDLHLNEIQKLVIDDEQIIRSIITKDRVIKLGHSRPNMSKKTDSQKFIDLLVKDTIEVEVIDSWDVWVEKGYIKWILRICIILILLIITNFTFHVVSKGLDNFRSIQLKKLIPGIPILVVALQAIKILNIKRNHKD